MIVSILDCTLRDGGYINNWEFPKKQAIKIINALNSSNVDIVELGYLDDKNGKVNDSTLFSSIKSINDLIGDIGRDFNKVVMINLFDFDVSKLPQQSKTKIDGIRLAFHKENAEEALIQAQTITDLGYKLFFQPMVTKNYSDDEFVSIMQKSNQLKAHAFYIVDSFGSMSLKDFKKYIKLANDCLQDEVCLGFHSHNNMQLAFSNAIELCAANFDREVIIDSSVYGMGRGAGNLNTELITNYLNDQVHKKYNVLPLLEVIDETLTFYFKKSPWGFSPAQYLSASLDCHPNYASYLVNKKTTHIADIQEVLEKIPLNKKVSFDEKIVDDLYQQFLLKSKSEVQGKISIPTGKKILLIASGHSVIDNLKAIKHKVESENYFVIALNHKPQFDCDYYFFSNQQRFDEFKESLLTERLAITSNIKCDELIDVVIDLSDVVYIGGSFITNVTMLMINYLISQDIQKIEIAGLDGYQMGRDNYAYDETQVSDNLNLFIELNQAVENSLMELKLLTNIELITPSVYENIL